MLISIETIAIHWYYLIFYLIATITGISRFFQRNFYGNIIALLYYGKCLLFSRWKYADMHRNSMLYKQVINYNC